MPLSSEHSTQNPASECDPGLTRLERDLERVYAASAPPRLRATLAQALRESATADRPVDDTERRSGRRYWRRRHGLVAAAVVAAAALVTGSALADQSPINRLFAIVFNNGDTAAHARGTASDRTPPLGTDVNIPQTVCGYTITIRRLYADLNRVVIGYTFTGQSDRQYSGGLYGPPTLAEAHGSVMREMTGAGDAISGGVGNNVDEFDDSAVATTTAPLALRMTIPTLHLYTATPLTDPKPCEHLGARTFDPVHTSLQSYPLTVKGPFTFDFAVPVTTSVRTAEINQKLISSHGTSVTLERVVVTPSEARVYLQGPPQNEIAGGASIAPTLFVGGTEIDSSVGMPLGGARESDSFGNWGVNLYQNHGEWALKVLTDPIVRNYRRSWTDSVTFQFTVP
jgi:hypothetical protein